MAMEMVPMNRTVEEEKADKIVVVKGKLYHNGWKYEPCDGGYMLAGYDGDFLNKYDDNGNPLDEEEYKTYAPYVSCLHVNYLKIPREINGTPVVAISRVAFGYNPFYPLKTIIIPDTVVCIASGAFDVASFLQVNITIDPSNPKYTVIDGNIRSKDGKTLHVGRGKGGEIFNVPEGITAIGDLALHRGDYTAIIIPVSVGNIGVSALPRGSDYRKKNMFRTIYYKGTKKEWRKIRIFDKKYELSGVKIYFFSEVFKKNTWHFASDGVTPEVWTKK